MINIPSCDEEKIYKIEKGDSLSSIAVRFDLPISWIKKTNNLYNDLIFPGDTLKINPQKQAASNAIEVEQIFPRREHKGRRGHLCLLQNYFRFVPKNTLKSPVVFDIIDIFSTELIVNPLNKEVNYFEINSKDENKEENINNADNDNNKTNETFKSNEEEEERDKTGNNYNNDDNEDDESSISDLKVVYVEETSVFSSIIIFRGKTKDLKVFITELDSKYRTAQREKNITVEARSPPPEKRHHRKRRVMSSPDLNIDPEFRRIRSFSMLIPIEINGGKSTILDDVVITSIRGALPIRFRRKDWLLKYQLSRDGCSMTAFFSQTSSIKPEVLLIKTSKEEIIGCFLPSGIKWSDHFYGSGESFVFSLKMDESKNTKEFNAYKWSKKNTNFIASTNEGIEIGGDSVSIFIMKNLLMGISDKCATYDSPILTSTTDFKISDLEIFSL